MSFTFRSHLFYTVLLPWVLLLSCRDNLTEPTQTATDVRIDAETFTTIAGGVIQLAALATINDAEQREVTADGTWSISPGLAGSIDATGLFQSFQGATGIETVRFEFQQQSATVQIEVTQGASRFTILPASVRAQAGETVAFRAIANTITSGSPTTIEFVTSETTWQVEQENMVSEMTSAGLLQTFTGVAAPESVRVVAEFSGLRATSYVVVQPECQPRFELVRMPAGSFVMGDDNGEDDEQPEHEVMLDAYDIGKFEISNREYVFYLNRALARGDILVDEGPGLVLPRNGPYLPLFYMTLSDGVPFITFDGSAFEIPVGSGFQGLPVTRITWFGAAAFCDFYGLRLPTEAEWERAARADRALEFGTADGTLTHELANYVGTGGRDTYADLAPVGSFPANPLGLFDMAGNVAEHVFNEYAADFYAHSPLHNPIGPGEAMPVARFDFITVLRGGSARSSAVECRAANRTAHNNFSAGSANPYADLASARYGFRVARSVQ